MYINNIKKIERLCKEIGDIRKNQMEILEPTATMTKMKNSWGRLSSKIEVTEERFSELETGQ